MYFNKGWKCFYGECENADYRGMDDSAFTDVVIPHDQSVEHDFDINESSGTGYLPGGTVWYRKHFDSPCTGGKNRVFVTFNGVYNNSRVWINSNYLGKRPYGYSTFTYELTDFIKNENNVLALKITRPQTADSRWFTGTGIYRDVLLNVTGRYSLADMGSIFVKTQVCSGSAQVTADYVIDGGEADIAFEITDACGNTVATARECSQQGSAAMKIENPVLWSDESPYLYTLRATVYDGPEISDTKEVKFGIRTLVFDCDNGLFVNGKATKLKGVCVHHDSGCLGAASYKSVWARRLENLRAAGCNAIRTSHNPPDPVLLDLCDEMGFYVMDEAFDEWEGFKNKWWQGHNVYPPRHFGYADDFHAWHEKDLADMVRRDRNHPCVIMWSIGNEIDYPNDPYGYAAFTEVMGNNDANKPKQERVYSEDRPDARRLTAMAKELVAIVKKHDTSRPVTAALSFPEMCEFIGITDELDIAGYNYRENLYEEHRKKHPERFICGSENGHTFEQWKAVRDRRDCCAQFLWTGIDYLGEARGWPYRASGAGIMDLAGFPKTYRHALRKCYWSSAPVLEISVAPGPWVWHRSINYARGSEIDVIVVTNLENPVITAGGKQIIPELTENCVYHARLTAGDDEIRVTATDENSKEYTDSLLPHAQVSKIAATVYDNTDSERGIRLIQVEARLTDENGVAVEDCDCDISVSVEGGTLLGLENGDIKDLTAYHESHRSTLYGRLIAYVRADAGDKVKITLSAENACTVVEPD